MNPAKINAETRRTQRFAKLEKGGFLTGGWNSFGKTLCFSAGFCGYVESSPSTSESGAEATAVQTLRECQTSTNLAKRLDCGRVYRRSSRARSAGKCRDAEDAEVRKDGK